jgi:hypothetical protein
LLTCCLPQGLIDLAPQLGALRLVLPPETLAWRLQLLQQGSSWLTPRLKDIQQRVLVLAGEQDLLIPSKDEAQRLGKALPRARTRVLPNRSHALLQEAGVDLYQLLEVGTAALQPAAAAVAAHPCLQSVDVCASRMRFFARLCKVVLAAAFMAISTCVLASSSGDGWWMNQQPPLH